MPARSHQRERRNPFKKYLILLTLIAFVGCWAFLYYLTAYSRSTIKKTDLESPRLRVTSHPTEESHEIVKKFLEEFEKNNNQPLDEESLSRVTNLDVQQAVDNPQSVESKKPEESEEENHGINENDAQAENDESEKSEKKATGDEIHDSDLKSPTLKVRKSEERIGEFLSRHRNVTLEFEDLVEKRWFVGPNFKDLQYAHNASAPVSQIPRILHFTWRTSNLTELPDLFWKIQMKWKALNPNWEIKIWTDEASEKLVQDFYPELYFFYNDFKVTAERSDIFRYLVLDRYGGFYADMDMEPLRPLDDLLNKTKNPGCMLALEPEVHAILLYNKYHMIGNAFLASKPKHPLWKWLLPQTIRRYFQDRNPKETKDATKITGPVAVDNVVQRNPSITEDCVMLKPDVTAPAYDIGQEPFVKCQKILGKTYLKLTHGENPYVRICKEIVSIGADNKDYPANSFMVHHWAHTWTPKDADNQYKNGTTYAESNAGIGIQDQYLFEKRFH